MKNIIFQKLDIINFKGIEKRSINFDMKTALRGVNGVGKTTIADALWWVLFNKDSSGSSDFPVKRKDKDGNDINNIIVDVNLVLTLNGTSHIFRRTQVEKWVTKRGDNVPVFSGNEQERFYNESSLSASEYQESVNNILSEDLFKLLTNPMHFMALDYKKRREELMKIVGNEKDIENTIRKSSALFLLDNEWSSDINVNKSFVQFFDFVKQKAKQNADELDRLPYQINELQLTVKDNLDEVSIKSLISAYSKELAQLNEVQTPVKSQSLIDAERQLREKELEHSSIVDKANAEYSAKRTETALAKQDHEYRIGSLESRISLFKNEIELNEKSQAQLVFKKSDLLEKYQKTKNDIWIAPVIETDCPVCHQAIKDLNVDKLLADDRLNFEQSRAIRLNEILTEGKDIAQRIDAFVKTNNTIKDRILDIDKEVEELRMKLSALPDVSKMALCDFIDQVKIEKLNIEMSELASISLKYYEEQITPGTVNNQDRKNELQALINDNNQRLGVLNAQKETLKRIDELKGREIILQADKNKFKTLVYLCESFERMKNEAIEKALSSHFGQVKWRLFEPQVNGAFKQVCDPLLDGKPYNAQSTGERIYTGCDIIKTFQAIYEIDTPVIIDNRESLTIEVPLTSQIISMYADDRYTTLQLA